ncbi:MerR HTH family regulatory protein/Protein of unknown function (DUF433) [Corynebacterium mustelae]|uniref:HTH merR-type domain-containing protein n=1 Tax=Corynebacterium mustelae TaxID=571915 RepID=A0A0G3GTQ9_9CORY|nr:DUF433 domain-containing protein [Corynebacterium mustelae]AKK04561.1 MerR HTH family regulatory protein/Protein of unknown function (DUF433) [Corynebacterium mustelae]
MTYTIDVAAYLSGASKDQLQRWARNEILVPEINPERPKIYSFRDIVALRTIAKLRVNNSLQRIRSAIARLSDYDLTEHLSEYKFATDGKSVKVFDEDNAHFLNLSKNPGQWDLVNLEDIYAPFMNMQGREVPDLRNPAQGIEINPQRLSGTPTIEDSRVPYDLIVDLFHDDMSAEEIAEEYPTISLESVGNAIAFNKSIEELAA